MHRREFSALVVSFLGSAALGPAAARAQGQPIQLQPVQGQPDPNQSDTIQADDDQIGQVATLQGTATVARAGEPSAALAVNDGIYKGDVLATGVNSALGVTFDDETTFSLTANARIVIDEYVYQEGAKGNAAIFNVARGTVAFVANAVAKDGDMKITTPGASLGIRGTTGVVDVPSSAAGGGESKIKLYPDADGSVGQIEVFNRQGGAAGRPDARLERFRPARVRWAPRRGAVCDHAAGGGARSRGGAAAVCLAYGWPADGDTTAAIARSQFQAAE